MARVMEVFDVYWLEEPLWAYDYDGLAELRRQANVRIAGGELNLGLHEFREYLRHGCLDVYQPDATFAGGITTARTVAGMAQAAGLLFAPHTWSNGIGVMANLHLAPPPSPSPPPHPDPPPPGGLRPAAGVGGLGRAGGPLCARPPWRTGGGEMQV